MSRQHYWNFAERTRQLEMVAISTDEYSELLDGYTRAVCELSEEIDRLEDLRRWRPMTEAPDVPARAPYVLIREAVGGKHDPANGTMQAMWQSGIWRDSDGERIGARELRCYQWAYIPGQEPAP